MTRTPPQAKETKIMKPWTEVTSSNLSALCVDEAGLRVRFTNGTEYLYADAGDDEFDAIVSAASPGRTFDRIVKRKFFGDKFVFDPEVVLRLALQFSEEEGTG